MLADAAQPEPLQNLSALVKAQLIYFSTAAEALSVSLSALPSAFVAQSVAPPGSRISARDSWLVPLLPNLLPRLLAKSRP